MDPGTAPDEIGDKLTKALLETPTTTMPAISFTMADVSTRLAALEDAVAELRKKIAPEAPKAVDFADILPSEKKGGGRKRKTRRRRSKKRRSN